MIISTGKSRRDTKWRTQDIKWEELAVKLGSFHRTHETMREYAAMTKDEQGKVKDIGGFVGGRIEGGRRTGANIRERYLITLDADNAPDDMLETMLVLWGGVEWVCYSTHSHRPGHTRLRFVFPIDRPVQPEMYPAIARQLASQIYIEAMDPTTYQPERLMYWPSCPVDAEPVYHWEHGVVMTVDELLHPYGEGDAWKDTRLWPISTSEQEIRVRETKRQGDPREKPGIVGQFCRAYDIPSVIDAYLPDVYEQAGEGRYTYTAGSTSAGAVLYDHGLFLYSNHATDPAGGLLCNAFDLVRVHKYGDLDAGQEAQEITRRPSYKAMCELAAQDTLVRRLAANAQLDDLLDDTQQEAEEDEHWADRLALNSKTGKPEQTIANTVLILKHLHGLAGLVAYNELQQAPFKQHPAPWDPPSPKSEAFRPRPWVDSDDANLYCYMEEHFGLSNRANTDDALRIVAGDAAYHPVRDYLSGLKWDGVERLDTMLVDHMAAEDSRYVRAVTRKWMCGAVARVMRPGCQFDNMLVLTGKQGLGKSKLMQIMSRGWFTDSLTRMDGSKESYEALDGAWIVEVAELAAAKRSESEQLKNFISKREDKYRKAYGKRQGTYPRQCVFYATTNDKEFLRDRTGARRFWPVEIKGIDHGMLTGLTDEVVDQIWAEAVVRWRMGESLWLDDPTLYAEAEAQQELYAVQDELVGLIEEFLDTPLPQDWYDWPVDKRRDWYTGLRDLAGESERATWTLRRDRVSITEIRCEMNGERKEGVGGNDASSRRIAAIMNNMKGWKRDNVSPRIPGYGRQRVYVREASFHT